MHSSEMRTYYWTSVEIFAIMAMMVWQFNFVRGVMVKRRVL